MLIAQITDIHLGFEAGNPHELNRRRFDEVLQCVLGLQPRPDVLLLTGDLADKSDDLEAYQRLRLILADCPIPYHCAMGNHDSRAQFMEVFPERQVQDGFVQYAIEGQAVRILVLDTLEVGRHSGGFCEVRAAWLRTQLAEADEQPTLIVLHHPPVMSGLSWMSENPSAEWVLRLGEIVERSSNIVAVVAGHFHRPLVTRWAGTTLTVCGSSAPQLPLDLAPIDVDMPDGRPMIVEAPPAFAIHKWTGHSLVTHFGTTVDAPVLSSYTEDWQPLLRKLADERGFS